MLAWLVSEQPMHQYEYMDRELPISKLNKLIRFWRQKLKLNRQKLLLLSLLYVLKIKQPPISKGLTSNLWRCLHFPEINCKFNETVPFWCCQSLISRGPPRAANRLRIHMLKTVIELLSGKHGFIQIYCVIHHHAVEQRVDESLADMKRINLKSVLFWLFICNHDHCARVRQLELSFTRSHIYLTTF